MIGRLDNWTSALLDWGVSPLRQSLIVCLVAVLVLVPGLSSMPVTDRDEARFAQASKQMIETGDLIDIRFQDQPRWKKPAGIYWLQAGSASIFGGAEAPIWAYRLPSAFAALLAALLTLWAARPLVGARGALIAGLMMTTTLLLVAEGHIAKTDAALAASATAALGGLAHVFLGRGGWGAAAVFWFGIAASILLKGPIVPAIAGFALAGLWWHRETRSRFGNLHILPGLIAVVVLTAPWLIAIWQVSDGKFFAESLGKDMAAKMASGQEKHWGPPGLYLGLVWITFWPWAALIPQAAGWAWRQRCLAWGLMVLAWIVPFWVVLEAIPTKLPHYVLPLYPALAIAVAGYVVSGAAVPIWARRLGAGLIIVPGLIIALGVILLPVIPTLSGNAGPDVLPIEPAVFATVLAVFAAFAVLAAGMAAWRGQLAAQIGSSVMAALLLYPAILAHALPGARIGFPSTTLAAAIKQYRACASGPAFSIGYHEPSLVFLTETGLRNADPTGALKALDEDPGALVLIEDRWIDIVGPLPPHVVRRSIRYFNPNRGKMATARLVTPDAPRWADCS